jgi:hypothetical protein
MICRAICPAVRGARAEWHPGGVDAARAETYLRLLAEAELRRALSLPRPDREPHQVWLAATTLIAAGVVDPDVAWQAVADFEGAASLRSAEGVRARGIVQRPWIASLAPAAQAGPGTPLRAVPVDMTLRLPTERDGWYGELRLMAVVMTDSHAALTVALRWAGHSRRSARPRPRHAPFHEIAALDDSGHPYRAALLDMGIEDGRDWWDCHYGLSPAPAAGTRWLDLGPGAGGAHARIDLTAEPTPAEIAVDSARPPSGPARLLDSAAEDLLCHRQPTSGTGETLSSRIAQVLHHLTRSGAIRTDDPAVLRVAAISQLLGLDLGTGLTAGGPLPEEWTSLLTWGDARDGPGGVASFAVALPAIDGARFALAGLRSSPEGASLHVMANGWEPRGDGWLVHGRGPRDGPRDMSLSWRARDDAGRWHLVSGMSWGSNQGMIQMHIVPPLHPAATSLEVIVTGASSRVRATVPLHWQAA